MALELGHGVVIIQGMGHGPIDQGRLADIGFQSMPQDGRLGLAAHELVEVEEFQHQRFIFSGKQHRQPIQKSNLGLFIFFPGN